MVLFEGLAFHIALRADLSGDLIVTERGTAVINRSESDPFQCFRIPKQGRSCSDGGLRWQ